MRTANLKEWIGRDDNAKPPPHVRARIFETNGGICHIAKRKIMPGELWDLDHIVALINGGENREKNMAPALRDKHREKTARDVAEKSTVARKRAKHLGVTGPKRKIQSRGFQRVEAQHTATRPIERRS